MNSCFHLANRMSYHEAEAVIADPDSPECLVTAAHWLLSQRPGPYEISTEIRPNANPGAGEDREDGGENIVRAGCATGGAAR